MYEILLSYRLLFGNDFRSRLQYRRSQRKRVRDVLPPGCKLDPYLNHCCRSGDSERSEGLAWNCQSFSKSTDFPIFAERLSILRKYTQKQKPSTLKALWSNKNDINAYHTFRAVLVFGSLGVILGLIQVVAGIIQAVYSIKAYEKG